MNYQSALGRNASGVAGMLFFAVALGIPVSAFARPDGFANDTPKNCGGCHTGSEPPTITIKPSKERLAVGEEITLDITIKATAGNASNSGLWLDSRTQGKITLVDTVGTRLHNDTSALHSRPKMLDKGEAKFQFKWKAPSSVGVSEFFVLGITSLPHREDQDLHEMYSSAKLTRASVAHGCDAKWYYPDEDKDGFGDEAGGSAQLSCEVISGKITKGGDCDDTKADVHPGAEEKCDFVDNNCDGERDEGLEPGLYYKDADGDGFAPKNASPEQKCKDAKGFAPKKGDCNDSKSDINPDAEEICDEVDNDCNGKVDDVEGESCSDKGGGDSGDSDSGGGCSVGTRRFSTSLPIGLALVMGSIITARLTRRRRRGR